MQVSDQGLVALMQHEGIVPAPYADSVGVLTYGIGHTAAAGAPDPASMPMGMPDDLDAALARVAAVFRRDIERYASDVAEAVTVPVEQHEFDALVSFHYNTGAIRRASLMEALNAGQRVRAGELFMNWSRPDEIIPRRKAERDLFMHGTYPTGGVTVWRVSDVGRVIWKPARVLAAHDALALVKGVEPALDTPLAFGSSDPRNRQIQTILADLGLYTRRIDDQWGQGQQAALDALTARHDEIHTLINGA